MVQITSFVLAFALSCGYVFAAPVNNTVGGDTLLQNGLDAQNLNSLFQNYSITDPCESGAKACIEGDEAKCNSEGKWEARQCPSNTQCFVLPNTKSQGTHLKCTSEQNALQAIQNTGAQGGVCGSNSTDSGSCSGSNDGSGSTATVTILVASSTTQTLGPQTTTIDQASAASLLSSLSASTTTSSSNPDTTNVDGTPDAAAAVVTGSVQGTTTTATPSIILLTTGSSSPSSSSNPSPTPDVALASASSPSPTTTSDSGYNY